MNLKLTLLAAVASVGLAGVAQANNPYLQGFETNASGWSNATDASGTSTLTRTASGGGTLGLTAAAGGYYGELTNGENGFTNPDNSLQPGYGDAGYWNFGGHAAGAYPGSAFTQSIDVYLNTSWAAATNAATPAFWIDMTAASQSTGAYDYGTEHNFRIDSPSGGSIGISADNGATFATASNSGWYTFQVEYSKGASGADPSLTTLTVLDPSNAVLGSTTLTNTSLSGDLGGTGYAWLTLWQDGFANDRLGVDNIQSAVVPLPKAAYAGLGLIAGLALLGGLKRRQRRLA